MNVFQNASFVTSCYDLKTMPADVGSEIIFLGRSNVGKSSLINALCQKKLLARTSKTPGRTQCLNVFSVDENRRFVDAPGYGFAKVPMSVKQAWQRLVLAYFKKRTSLRAVVVVMDIRHPLQPADLEWLGLLAGSPVSWVVVLNKRDCLGRMQQKKSYDLVERYCRENNVFANILIVSSRTGDGIDVLRDLLVDVTGLEKGC